MSKKLVCWLLLTSVVILAVAPQCALAYNGEGGKNREEDVELSSDLPPMMKVVIKAIDWIGRYLTFSSFVQSAQFDVDANSARNGTIADLSDVTVGDVNDGIVSWR